MPADLGEEAGNCSSASDQMGWEEMPEVVIYPNPVSSEFKVHWALGFSSLMVLDSSGKAVLEKTFDYSQNSASLRLNLKPGLYVVRAANEKCWQSTRFINLGQ